MVCSLAQYSNYLENQEIHKTHEQDYLLDLFSKTNETLKNMAKYPKIM